MGEIWRHRIPYVPTFKNNANTLKVCCDRQGEFMHEKPLEGKVAIVTGAGRGIGRTLALTLAQNGALVSLAARTEDQLEAALAEIQSFGGQAASFRADISLEADVKALIQNTFERFGRLDMLVNNAAVGTFGPLVETTTEQWDQTMAVNARGPFLTCREAIPYLRQQAQSFIVNISSVVGVKGYADQAAYSASKHALMGMTSALAKEVQKDGIRVHAICPGGIDTQLIRRARPDLDPSVLMRPEEIADILLFLLGIPILKHCIHHLVVDYLHVVHISNHLFHQEYYSHLLLQ